MSPRRLSSVCGSRIATLGLAALCAAVLAFSGSAARADEPAPPATPAAETTPAPAAELNKAPAAPNGASLDFDLFGDAPKGVTAAAPNPKLAKLERQVKTRRRILSWHQGFGFATLVALAAACVLGQLDFQDEFGGGNFTQKYQYPHLGLALGSAGLFATTGVLGLAAPNPYPKPIRADAALLHKIMMGIATAGMVTQLVLGEVTASQGGNLNQRNLAIGHLTTGYVTFAAMMTGYLAYVF